VEWPQDIRDNLITDTNLNGVLSINDLELAGYVLNWLTLECQQNLSLKYKRIGAFCDNASTSKSTVAGILLRMLGMRIHTRQASSIIPLHIAGDNNKMADVVSRAFKNGQYFEAASNLATFFNSNFPLSQNKSSKTEVECKSTKKATMFFSLVSLRVYKNNILQ
jgi:hypothetical protein